MKKIFVFLTVLTAFFSCGIGAWAKPDNAPVSAECATLYSVDTDEFLYDKNADMRHPMASTTKIMTAIIAIEHSDPDEIISVPAEAVGIEGSSIYMTLGEKISMNNLLYALLLQSANDAATLIAIHIGGSIEKFAEMMNDKAKEIGAVNTHFDNPHGLDSETHYTTAHDLAKIAAYAMEDDTFREIASTKTKTIITETADGDITRVLVNHNKLLRIYDGATGIKTGYTKKTGRCLVSAAERDGVMLICVTLDAPSDWSDHKKLLDDGFSLFERQTIANAGELEYRIPVLNSSEEYLTVKNSEEISACVRKNHDTGYRFVIDTNDYIIAPVKKGEMLGRVYVYADDRLIASSPLTATENIKAKKK